MNKEKLRLMADISFDWFKKYYIDFIVIFLVPIILLLLSVFVPSSFQESLVLHHNRSVFYQFFTSNFFHSSSSHLLNNSVSYLFSVFLIYMAYSLIGRRDLFYLSFFVILLVFSSLIQFLNFLLIEFNEVPFGTSRGFSAVNGAFIGVLPIAIIYYVKNKFNLKSFSPYNYTLGLFMFGFLISVLHSLPHTSIIDVGFPFNGLLINYGQLILWLIISIIMFLLFMRYKVLGIEGEFSGFYAYYLFVLLLLFAYLAFSLFPNNLVMNGHFINFSSHWIGYILGFFGVLTTTRTWSYYIKDRNRNN